jgi:ectoine hydroxylase-related dioxygenase (phytanoyl-CoA dioxygenase family)
MNAPLGPIPAFLPHELGYLNAFFLEHGFAVLRGLFDDDFMNAMELECVTAQNGVVSGELSERHGNTMLTDDADGLKTVAFANYVQHIDELCPTVAAAIADSVVVELMQRWLGPQCWTDPDRFGTIYQDARPGRESSYTRIGWHSDWQSGPNIDVWPSVAFTFHVDRTSPDNGFLRVVPGSHKWLTPAPFENVNGAVVPAGSKAALGHTSEPPPFPMPLRFEYVPGEVAVYVERGDILFHDAYLWHSAARATSDTATRRHVRGGYYGGTRTGVARYDEFVKNAAR